MPSKLKIPQIKVSAGRRRIYVVGALLVVGAVYIYTGGKPITAPRSTSACQVQITADNVNVRSAPTNTAAAVDHLNKSTVDAQATVQSGFRKLAEGRWVAVDFATPVAGSHC